MKTLKIGLFGFGVVGKGLFDLLGQTVEIKAEIKKICIKHPEKNRSIDAHFFTTNGDDLINDPEIDIIVELIDHSDEALEIVRKSFIAGKPIVSANKKMIAENLTQLLEWQHQYQVPFLYEASCCAGIPIIRNLEEYYDNDLLKSIHGIFNGSTNYILTQLFRFDKDFEEVLLDAQEKGFAESNPSLDIDAIDPKYKLVIILFHAFGIVVNPTSIFNYGIRKLNKFDINFAKKRGKNIRLIANCVKKNEKIQAWCIPTFVNDGSILSNTENEFNAIFLEGAFSDQQCLIGKGAGDFPTGSAVLSDISALSYKYRYEYKKRRNLGLDVHLDSSQTHNIYVRFNGNTKLDFEDFDTISEQYSGSDGNYIVGNIKQNILQNSLWIDDPEINIILMN